MTAEEGLIVILDALNEAPFTGPEFEEWVADTRSWLLAAGARLHRLLPDRAVDGPGGSGARGTFH